MEKITDLIRKQALKFCFLPPLFLWALTPPPRAAPLFQRADHSLSLSKGRKALLCCGSVVRWVKSATWVTQPCHLQSSANSCSPSDAISANSHSTIQRVWPFLLPSVRGGNGDNYWGFKSNFLSVTPVFKGCLFADFFGSRRSSESLNISITLH